MVLRNAEVKGVSGKNIIIVKHAGGVGMYSYSRFTPDSAAVISAVYPKVATPLPLPEAKAAEAANASSPQQGNRIQTPPPTVQPASDATASALSINNRLFNAAQKRLDVVVKRERAELIASQERNSERRKLENEITRLKALVEAKDDELTDHEIYRGETRPARRELRDSHDKLTWDQEHTLLYQATRDKRKKLENLENSLKEMIAAQEQEVHAFDSAAFDRQQKLNRIFDDHNCRIRMRGELISSANMEAAFNCVQ